MANNEWRGGGGCDLKRLHPPPGVALTSIPGLQAGFLWCRFAEQQRLHHRRRPPPRLQTKVNPWTHHPQTAGGRGPSEVVPVLTVPVCLSEPEASEESPPAEEEEEAEASAAPADAEEDQKAADEEPTENGEKVDGGAPAEEGEEGKSKKEWVSWDGGLQVFPARYFTLITLICFYDPYLRWTTPQVWPVTATAIGGEAAEPSGVKTRRPRRSKRWNAPEPP